MLTENCASKLIRAHTAPANASLQTHVAHLHDHYEKYLALTADKARKSLPREPTMAFDDNIKVDVVFAEPPAEGHTFKPLDSLNLKLVVSGGTIDFEQTPDLRLVAIHDLQMVRVLPIKKEAMTVLAPGFEGEYTWKCVRPGIKRYLIIDNVYIYY